MRILQILPELNVGGVETGTVDLAKYLRQKGHTCIVVSHGGVMVEKLKEMGCKHYTLPVHKKSLWTVFRCIKELKKIIQYEDIDVVHARSRVPAWIAFFACRQTKATFITTCHGYYSKHLFSQVMGWGKYVIVPSEVIGRHMIDDFGVPHENIRLIPRSVDLDRFDLPREKKTNNATHVISMIGRITPLKGHIYFLRAMAKVIRTMPFVRIFIIGDAPSKKESYKQELEILIKRLGLSDYVEFLGNRQDIPQLLSKTDVLVLSTITQEAFGRVILEAQAAGVPVVATRVGGVVEIIEHEKTGLLVMPKDTEAMAQAVVRLLRDKTLGESLAAEAKKKLNAQYTLAHMAERTIAVYQDVITNLKILVIKISSIGDVILISASLKALRQKFPKAQIHCLVGKKAMKVLQRCPYLDGVIVFDERDKAFIPMIQFSQKLRKQRFDTVIDFQNNRASHWLTFLSFPKDSYGFKKGRRGAAFLSKGVVLPKAKIGPVEHQFQILKELGMTYDPKLMLELWPTEEDQSYAKALLDSEWLGNSQNIIGINLAASEKWETKNWPLDNMARLCDQLAAENIRVLITGIDKDMEKARELLRLTKSKPANFVGKTNILQLAALIKHCRVFISPDSAPLHLAAAMQTPFIAFFGPTDSTRHLPPAVNFRIIEKKPICAPCYSQTCRVGTHICMKDIRPEEVASHVKELLLVKV